MAQYLKPDTELGYVEDSVEIESLKVNNMRQVVLGCMLGDFDEVGSYVVDPEIKKELIAMDKYVVETFENIEFCRSELRLDKQISFMVTFEGNRATLALIEKMHFEGNFKLNGGTYSNVNEYILDSVETSGEINRNVIYARWHIKSMPSQIIDIFSCDESVLAKYFGIVSRFKYLLAANKTLLEKEEALEDVEAGYVSEMFSILKHYPQLEKQVVENLNKTLALKKDAVNIKNPFFVKTLNEILENTIDINLNVLSEQERNYFLNERRAALMMMNVKRDAIVEMNRLKVADSQQQVLRMRTDEQYANKSLQELGSLFVGEHQQVMDRLQGQDTNLFARAIARYGTEIQASDNRSKLIGVLGEYGITSTLGINKEQTKTDGVSVAPATTVANKGAAKPATANKSAAAKSVGKSAAKGGKSAGGSAKKPAAKKPEEKASAKKKESTPAKTTKPVARGVYVGKGGYGGTSASAANGDDLDLDLARRIIGDAVQSRKSMTNSVGAVSNANQTVGTASQAKKVQNNVKTDLNNVL